VLVYGVLFVPRVTVGVVDKTGGTPVRVVANVPFGMAALGGLTSSIGNSITELFETAFQTLPGPAALPAELSYQQNGLMFGSRLIQETRRASIPDPARPDRPRQLRRQLHHVRHRRWHHLAGGLLVVCRSLGDDGRHEPGTLQHHHDSGGRHHEHLRCQVYASIGARLPAQITDLTRASWACA
jgi:conjugal transfer mating pair stabilization protein TraG